MRNDTTREPVYSKPTTCLRCHLVVRMIHGRDADPANGAWECPHCGSKYPFLYWKIRKQADADDPRKTTQAIGVDNRILKSPRLPTPTVPRRESAERTLVRPTHREASGRRGFKV